jgi:Diguanylate cyclase, GGDEF domain
MSVREDPATPNMHPRDGQARAERGDGIRNGGGTETAAPLPGGSVQRLEARPPDQGLRSLHYNGIRHELDREINRSARDGLRLSVCVIDFDDGLSAILPQTNRDEAQRIAARLRSQLMNSPTPSFERALTPSLGVGKWTPGTPIEELLAAADRAVLAAKRSARLVSARGPGMNARPDPAGRQ